MRARLQSSAIAVAALLLAACAAPQPQSAPQPRQVRIPPPRVSVIAPAAPAQPAPAPDPGPAPTWEKDGPPDPADIPEGLENIPDPIPQNEPPSAGGNMRSYEVFGRTYNVLASAQGYRETGLASWYGKKFHGRRTSNGERYDMFKLTAAHKHLPLPTYARVTNLANGKSVIVRINDRGPFHSNRIIDLSYAAATRLGTVGKIATVEIEAITPGVELPPPPKIRMETATVASAGGSGAGSKAVPRLLQVAAYSDPINAVNMRDELEESGLKPVQVRVGMLDNGDTVHRVMVGPFEERKRMDEMRIRLRNAGYEPLPIFK